MLAELHSDSFHAVLVLSNVPVICQCCIAKETVVVYYQQQLWEKIVRFWSDKKTRNSVSLTSEFHLANEIYSLVP